MNQAVMVQAAGDRRDAVRIVAKIGAGLRRQGQPGEPATIFDISTAGCKVEAMAPVPVGSNIWLKASALPSKPVFARVVWAEGYLLGCEFVTPLPHATLLKMLAHA